MRTTNVPPIPSARPDPPTPGDRDRRSSTVVLIDRCRTGDQDALEQLARRFYPPVYRMIRARLGPRLLRKEGVEDLVQTTFLRLLESIETFEPRPDAHFTAYLARIAHTAVLQRVEHYQAQKRDPDREVPLPGRRSDGEGSSISFHLVDDSLPPEERVAQAELAEIVDACMTELDEMHREVILLRDYAGADWDYIAQQTRRRTPEAAAQLHRRARLKLADAVRARV